MIASGSGSFARSDVGLAYKRRVTKRDHTRSCLER